MRASIILISISSILSFLIFLVFSSIFNFIELFITHTVIYSEKYEYAKEFVCILYTSLLPSDHLQRLLNNLFFSDLTI